MEDWVGKIAEILEKHQETLERDDGEIVTVVYEDDSSEIVSYPSMERIDDLNKIGDEIRAIIRGEFDEKESSFL